MMRFFDADSANSSNSPTSPDAAIEAELRSYFAITADQSPEIEAFWQRLSPQLEVIPMAHADEHADDRFTTLDGLAAAPVQLARTVTPKSKRHSPLQRRLGVLGAVAAVLALVVVFALVVHSFLGVRHIPGKTATQPPPPPSVWKQTESFQIPDAINLTTNVFVAVAPSDPKIIYEFDESKAALTFQRSENGGKIWRTLRINDASSNYLVGISLQVNPLNAQIVYATVGSNPPSLQCTSSDYFCFSYLQYVSADGGSTWTPLTSPLQGAVVGIPYQNGTLQPIPRFAVQNGRLYAPLIANIAKSSEPYTFSFQLASSTDGIHWTLADAPLAAQNLAVVEYAATPTGSTLFVTTVPDGATGASAWNSRKFWRSDDAGADWKDLGAFPKSQSGVPTYLLGATTAGHTVLVYYGASQKNAISGGPVYTFAPQHIFASANNGKTWQAAPKGEFSADQLLELWPTFDTGNGGPQIGSLNDGSLQLIVATGSVTTSATSLAIYAWKPGDTNWRQVSQQLAIPQGATSGGIPTPGYGLAGQWFTPATSEAPATLWALTIKKGVFTLRFCELG